MKDDQKFMQKIKQIMCIPPHTQLKQKQQERKKKHSDTLVLGVTL